MYLRFSFLFHTFTTEHNLSILWVDVYPFKAIAEKTRAGSKEQLDALVRYVFSRITGVSRPQSFRNNFRLLANSQFSVLSRMRKPKPETKPKSLAASKKVVPLKRQASEVFDNEADQYAELATLEDEQATVEEEKAKISKRHAGRERKAERRRSSAEARGT